MILHDFLGVKSYNQVQIRVVKNRILINIKTDEHLFLQIDTQTNIQIFSKLNGFNHNIFIKWTHYVFL